MEMRQSVFTALLGGKGSYKSPDEPFSPGLVDLKTESRSKIFTSVVNDFLQPHKDFVSDELATDSAHN